MASPPNNPPLEEAMEADDPRPQVPSSQSSGQLATAAGLSPKASPPACAGLRTRRGLSYNLSEDALLDITYQETIPPVSLDQDLASQQPIHPARHPWTELYGPPTTKLPRGENIGSCPEIHLNNLAASYTLEHVMEFREMVDAIGDSLPLNLAHPPDTKEEVFDYVIKIPSQPFAPYRVANHFGPAVNLEPEFPEIHANDRADLKLLKLMDRAVCRTSLGQHVYHAIQHLRPGDLLYVLAVAGNPKRQRDPQKYEFHHVNSVEDEPAYQVTEFQIVSRTITSDQLIFPIKHGRKLSSCLVEGSNIIFTANRKIFPGEDARKPPYLGTVFEPIIRSKRFLDTLINEVAVCELLKDIAEFPPPTGSILTVSRTSRFERMGYSNIQGCLENSPDFMKVLLRGAAFSAEAVSTMVNADMDPRYHVAVISDIEQQEGAATALTLTVNFGSQTPPQRAWGSARDGQLRFYDRSTLDIDVIGAIIDQPTRTMTVRATINRSKAAKLSRGNITRGTSLILQQVAEKPFNPAVTALRQSRMGPEDRGWRIAQSLFGGRRISDAPLSTQEPFTDTRLSPAQTKFAQKVIQECTDMMMAESCFGGGKSTTIAVAAHALSRLPAERCLLLTATNAATVNLTLLFDRLKVDSATRLITANHRDKLDASHATSSDLPIRIREAVHELIQRGGLTDPHRIPHDEMTLLNYGLSRGFFDPQNLPSRTRIALEQLEGASFINVAAAWFRQEKPSLLLSTIDSAIALYTNDIHQATDITTILVDEGSQLPPATVLAILVTFPAAKVVIVGDRQQLPPFKPENLSSFLSFLGTKSIMDVISYQRSCPIVRFFESYRCRNDVTTLLSGMFYQGKLVPKRPEGSSYRLPGDIWPRHPSASSIRLWNINEQHNQVGSSLNNREEATAAVNLARCLAARCANASIAVLGFYRAQIVEVMLEFGHQHKNPVFFGTVDAAQGREFDMVIILTTRASGPPNSFVGDAKRLNVAVSRAKDKIWIFGNRDFLKTATHWRPVLQHTA